MSVTKTYPDPGDCKIYDRDDNVLVEYMNGRAEEFLAVAKDVATKRGEIVFYYGDPDGWGKGLGRHAVEPSPLVGMGCTLLFWTDRHAGTVIAVSPSGHKVTVREDKAIRTDSNGMSESQNYRFEPDPDGRVHTLYRQGDGRYGKSPRLVLGVRGAYHDYSF
jgi:hypothetical protein